MSSFKEFVQRLDELTAHKPKSVNVGREMQVMRATGTAAGENIEGRSQIMHSLLAIVQRTYRIMLRKEIHPHDIEEFLLDSLRMAILFTNEEGQLQGGIKQRMSTTEFVSRTKRKRRDAARRAKANEPIEPIDQDEPDEPGELPGMPDN